KRDEEGEPVCPVPGRADGLGEQLGRAVVISLAEPDLPEGVVQQGDVEQMLYTVGPGEFVVAHLAQLGLAELEQVASARIIVLQRRQVAQHSRYVRYAQLVPRLAKQRQALVEKSPCADVVPGRLAMEPRCGQRQATLARRKAFAFGCDRLGDAGQLVEVA